MPLNPFDALSLCWWHNIRTTRILESKMHAKHSSTIGMVFALEDRTRSQNRHSMIIGITTTYTNPDGNPIERVTVDYLKSVGRAGGVPMLLPPQPTPVAIQAMLDRVDGLLLTGGGDIDPTWYTREGTLEQVAYVSRKRDEFEFGLAKTAYAMGMPVLGICRGMQVMNIAFCGSLFQDLIACGITENDHLQQPPYDAQDQRVILQPGTHLAELFGGRTEIMTNSMHHQGIREVAPGFRVNAESVDGVVEGIEDPSKPFYLGVQWHPEYLTDNGILFETLCAEAVRFRSA